MNIFWKEEKKIGGWFFDVFLKIKFKKVYFFLMSGNIYSKSIFGEIKKIMIGF